MLSVAVFVGEPEETAAELVQLYRAEGDHRAREATLLRDGEAVATVVDLPWLGEDPDHWERARRIAGRVVLAGGLGPHNLPEAIRSVQPWAVDGARATESSPGVKDPDKLRAFVEAARD